ncbi:hypothetical protein IQ07DRAFT_249633 [Pyrenochaeta sp. DS3sAY3a]|nr:hypothetical protein IQ07DRAFT_249633 [Pyrenochaeta sp. DS3sAY3a]
MHCNIRSRAGLVGGRGDRGQHQTLEMSCLFTIKFAFREMICVIGVVVLVAIYLLTYLLTSCLRVSNEPFYSHGKRRVFSSIVHCLGLVEAIVVSCDLRVQCFCIPDSLHRPTSNVCPPFSPLSSTFLLCMSISSIFPLTRYSVLCLH